MDDLKQIAADIASVRSDVQSMLDDRPSRPNNADILARQVVFLTAALSRLVEQVEALKQAQSKGVHGGSY